MADPIVRSVAFYWRDKLAVEVNRVRVKFMMGRTALFGQKGLEVYSKGAATMQLTVSGFVSVTGSAISNDMEKMLAQEDIDCSFILGGKYYRQRLAVIDYEGESDSEKGTVTEQVTLEGKKPRIVG